MNELGLLLTGERVKLTTVSSGRNSVGPTYTVGPLSKRGLDRNYYRIWALVGFRAKEAGFTLEWVLSERGTTL